MEPLTPVAADIFPRRSALQNFFFYAVILSATSAASYNVDLPGAHFFWLCFHARALP